MSTHWLHPFRSSWFFLVISVLWISCTTPGADHKSDLSAVVAHVVPSYAEGFDWKVLADSTYLITLFNLESPGDTLQMIRWKPRPVSRLACLSTTHVPFLSALECLSLVKGVGFADRLMDTTAKRMVDEGEILNLTSGNELEPEVVFSIQPELLFVYPFGGKSYDKFLSKGIGCVQVSEYLERHPLGRAEWIRLIGCLLGKQAAADSVFSAIESRYVSLRDSIAVATEQRPVVFAGSMDGDRWAVPSANSYLATLIHDAGGKYLFTDSSATGNLVLPFETFYSAASTADYWGKIIYETNPASADVIIQGDSRLRNLPAFQKQHVFVCNTLATDYYGRALLEPSVLLNDLQHIFRGTPSDAYQPTYFQPWYKYD
jgi:iron complex transport system substrate-binding protein